MRGVAVGVPQSAQDRARYHSFGGTKPAYWTQWATKVPHHGVSSSRHQAFSLVSHFEIVVLCLAPGISRRPMYYQASCNQMGSAALML